MFKDLMSKCGRFERSLARSERDCELNARANFCYSDANFAAVSQQSLCCAIHSCVFAAGMQSSSLKLFASVEQKPMLLKRQAFAMFSGEIDQYHLYLPLIQGTRPRRLVLSQRSLCVMHGLRNVFLPFLQSVSPRLCA